MHQRVNLYRNYFISENTPTKYDLKVVKSTALKFAKIIDSIHKKNLQYHIVHGRILVRNNYELQTKVNTLYHTCERYGMNYGIDYDDSHIVIQTQYYKASIYLKKELS